MSAIYQRARPIHWDEVVGQEHVKDVLRAALEAGRVGHAYLFSGPRGVGKTTTARLIAMTANCTGPDPKPCGTCPSCLEVRAGSHPDVLEIDAASNNSVDDVRELREKVGLAAMRGGKKIYILDEAHMMSRAAFNALLKTLEEPPAHVIFILATTEPEKVLPTIMSRCQHYRFRRLTDTEIAGKLTGIAEREGVRAQPEALALIGRLADGAMRDGESLLERMLAAGTNVTRAGVEAALGLPPGERVRDMARALVLGDAAGALGEAGRLYRDGFAARTVVEGLVSALRDALHAELGLDGEAMEGADVPRLLRLQAALDEQEARFARAADLGSLELALTHALLKAEGDSAASGAPARPVAAASAPAGDLAARLTKLERDLAALRASGARPAAPAGPGGGVPAFDPGERRGPAGPVPARAPVDAAPPPPTGGTWADVVRLAGMQTRAFLKPARMHTQDGYVSLTYDERGKFHARQVADKFDEVAKLVARVFGPVTFELISPDVTKRAGPSGRAGGSAPSGGNDHDEPGPTEPAPRRATPPTPAATAAPRERAARGPDFAPLPDPAPRAEVTPRRASVDDIPPFGPPTPRRREPAAPAAEVRVPPPSPDDAVPAPLPQAITAPAAHVADAPPLPAEAGARKVYIEPEPITMEPDWDDLGGDMPFGPPKPRAAPPATPEPSPWEDAPAAVAVATPVPATAPLPAPEPSPWEDDADPAPAAPKRAVPATRGAAGIAGIRQHPAFQDIQRMFPGRPKGGGQLRTRAAPAAADATAEDDET